MMTLLTIHATMTPAGRNLRTLEIDRRDRSVGYTKIGYHAVIERDGTIGNGRPIDEPSVFDELHEARIALAFCLVGGANDNGGPEDNFTDDQWRSLSLIVKHNPDLRVVSKTPSLTAARIIERTN